MAVLQEYKCPNCNGAIQFDSNIQKMKCPYCDAEFDMQAVASHDASLNQVQPDNMEWNNTAGQQWQEGETDGLRVYVCNSCGGQIVGDENTAATRCPYCDNPVVMAGQFVSELRPDLVVPFQLDKEQAKVALSKHLSKKPLLPKLFKSQNRIESVQGIYVPFWLFDTNVQANIRYQATRVRTWSDSNYIYTRTSYYSLLRAGRIGFDNVPVDGSSKMSNDLMESI